MNCTKAIIAVAGFGTRRLPITKSIQKSMLPVCNRPIVDYVVEDCVKAGIKDIYLAIDETFGGDQVRAYYEPNTRLEEFLQDRGKTREVQALRTMYDGVQFHFFHGGYKPEEGYGTALPAARFNVPLDKDEQVLVLMGDDFILNQDGSSEVRRLLDAVEAAGATAGMLTVEIPAKDVSSYGVLELDENDNLKRIVEKPSVEDAPSNLINISKYVFNAELFERTRELVKQPRTDGSEYYIVDPITDYAKAGNAVLVQKVVGEYLDGGTLEGWMYANQRVYELTQ